MKKEKEIRSALETAGIVSIAKYLHNGKIHIALHGCSRQEEQMAKQYIEQSGYLQNNEVLL